MDKKRIITQNIIFFVITAIIYFISFFAILNMNRSEIATSLNSYSQQVSSELISERNADDVIIEFSLIDNFRVSIYEENNDTPIADTRPFPEIEGGFAVVLENLDKTYYQYSDTINADMVYHASYDTDSGLYIRVGFPRSDSEKTSMMMLYFGVSGFLILDILFMAYSFFNFKKSLLPLKMTITRLQGIVQKVPDQNESYSLKSLGESIDKVGYEFEKQLKETNESREKLDFIINSLTQGIIVISGNSKVIMINNEAANLLKVDKKQIINWNYKNIELDDRFYKSVEKVINKDKAPHFDIQINDRDYMFEFSSINYQWSKEENKLGCLVFMYDITSQKNADEMQRDFFANASHELKSPLTSILGYQEMIKEGIISSKDELEDANTRTLKEAQRMKGIVKYMMENSRNLDVISVSEHSVSKYITAILDSLNFEIQEKKIVVKTKLEDFIIKMNHDDLDKLLRNIILNAVKYNKKGGLIEIISNANDRTLSIRDTGIGMKQSEIDKIFDRFYMVDKGRNRDSDSSGIGLSIVKRIMEYYNLKIEVKTKINEGSDFIIHF